MTNIYYIQCIDISAKRHFCKIGAGKISDGSTGDVAVDQYNRYKVSREV